MIMSKDRLRHVKYLYGPVLKPQWVEPGTAVAAAKRNGFDFHYLSFLWSHPLLPIKQTKNANKRIPVIFQLMTGVVILIPDDLFLIYNNFRNSSFFFFFWIS